jgi:WD40 repeat protein
MIESTGGTFNTRAVFTQQQKYVTVAMSDYLKVYGAKSASLLFALHAGSTITSIYANPDDDKQVYISTEDGKIQLWDIERGTLVIEQQFDSAIDSLFVTDRVYFYVNGFVRSVNLKLEQQENEFAQQLNNFCVSRDGQLIIGTFQRTLYVHQKSTGATQTYRHQDVLCALAYNNAREIIATSDIQGRIHIRYATGQRSTLKWHPVQVDALTFSLDGNYLFSGAHDSRVVTWKLNTNETFKIFHSCSRVNAIDVTEGLESIVVVCASNEVQVIDVTENKQVCKISGLYKDLRESPIKQSLVIEPVHSYSLMTGTNILQWYDLINEREDAREVVQYKAVTFDASRFGGKALECFITGLVFSHDGQHMVHTELFGQNINIKFWRMDPVTKKYTLATVIDTPHTDQITSVTFNPIDIDMCVTTSLDGDVKLWTKDVEGRFLCTGVLQFKKLAPQCASFSHDGTVLAIGFENVLVLWDVKTLSLLQHFALQSVPRKLFFVDDERIVIAGKELILYSVVENANMWTIAVNVNNIIQNGFKKSEFLVQLQDQALLFDVVDAQTNPLQQSFDTSRDSQLAFTDADRFVEISKDLRITFYNVRDSTTSVRAERQVQAQGQSTKHVSQFKRKQALVQEDAEYYSFDPERGIGAWKDMFSTSASHSLTSMADCYNVFMDNFLVKASKPKETQVEQVEKKPTWMSEQSKQETESFDDDMSAVTKLVTLLGQNIKL